MTKSNKGWVECSQKLMSLSPIFSMPIFSSTQFFILGISCGSDNVKVTSIKTHPRGFLCGILSTWLVSACVSMCKSECENSWKILFLTFYTYAAIYINMYIGTYMNIYIYNLYIYIATPTALVVVWALWDLHLIWAALMSSLCL